MTISVFEKLEKLIDVWTEVGESLLESNVTPAQVNAAVTGSAPAKRTRTKKEKKAEPEALTPLPAAAPEMFPTAPAAAVASSLQNGHAKERCQEVMGLFIRRHLKSTPPGLDRAKAILLEVCGRQVGKLEDLTSEECQKLVPRFEAELEKTA